MHYACKKKRKLFVESQRKLEKFIRIFMKKLIDMEENFSIHID